MMSAQLQQQAAGGAGATRQEGESAAAVPPTSATATNSGAGDPIAPPASTMRNRAGDSNSPYVQLHRDTPVAWQLLDDEAVELARRENKLIFMNIGFKACHYCRLTTQESFSHPAVAELLNSTFVPIIVDREERPDVDTIYMNYIQAVNSAGGWPLNLFLTPQLEPVFGGTYWPGPGGNGNGNGVDREDDATSSRDGEDEDRLDFLMILRKLQKVWAEQEAKCRREAKEIVVQLREFAAEGTLGTRQPAIAPTPAMSASTTIHDSGFLPDAQHPALSTETDGDIATRAAAAGLPAQEILAAVEATSKRAAATAAAANDLDVDLDQLEEAYTHISKTFDPINGGFNLAPKFPTPSKLSFLLRLARFPRPVADVVGHDEVRHATHMALHTLRRIRDSGLRDHIGSGFARYSATDDWSVPHFEKMVPDNALLLGLYLDAWLSTSPSLREGGLRLSHQDEFADVVLELADYLTSAPILTSDGLFATSEASDSFSRKGDKHMREGGYYLWTRREFEATVSTPLPGEEEAPVSTSGGGRRDVGREQLARVAAAHWNVLEHGNVDRTQDPNDEFISLNVLRVVKDAAELGAAFGIPADEVRRMLATARRRLAARREKDRVRPEVDDQAVLSYNGMVIGALARTGSALRESGLDVAKGQELVRVAEEVATRISETFYGDEGGAMCRTFRAGRKGNTPALAEDYAFLIEGLLDLYESTGNQDWLFAADELQDKQIELFYDHIIPTTTSSLPISTSTITATAGVPPPAPHRSSSGGFYTTPETAPHAILRLKDGMDTSQPSTNAVSALNLFRLGLLLTKPKFDALARETIRAFEVEMLQYPWLFTGLLSAVVTARLGGENELAVVLGDGEDAVRARREFATAPRAAVRALVHAPAVREAGPHIPQLHKIGGYR